MKKALQIAIISDQVTNNEVDTDEDMVEYLTQETGVDRSLIETIVRVERPLCLTNPFHIINFKKYGF